MSGAQKLTQAQLEEMARREVARRAAEAQQRRQRRLRSDRERVVAKMLGTAGEIAHDVARAPSSGLESQGAAATTGSERSSTTIEVAGVPGATALPVGSEAPHSAPPASFIMA